MSRRFLGVVFGALVAGCATPSHYPSDGFWINGAVVRLEPARLAALRANWNDGALSLAATSHSDPVDHRWILDLVALNEELGTAPCHHVVFERIEMLPLKVMTTALPSGNRKEFRPVKYNENWHIDACGAQHRWRVMDDANDPSNELTVLLLGH